MHKGGKHMTVTQFYEGLVNYVNGCKKLPFDAKVMVMRSVHNEMEMKYAENKPFFMGVTSADQSSDEQKGQEKT